jgi:hypothetical protein
MNKKLTNFRQSSRHPSQNDLPPIDKFHPDWWYYRQEMDEPDEINNNYRNESRNMNKKLIRLTESDLHMIVKESVNRILRESTDYAEVRSDYYDEERGATAIDAWKLYRDSDNDGETVAYVYDDGRVEWINPNARNSQRVNDEIKLVLADIGY